MKKDILRVEDVPKLRTSIHLKDKRFAYGQRIINLGNVTIEDIQKVLNEKPKAFKVFIGGFPLTIDDFNRFVLNGEIHW